MPDPERLEPRRKYRIKAIDSIESRIATPQDKVSIVPPSRVDLKDMTAAHENNNDRMKNITVMIAEKS